MSLTHYTSYLPEPLWWTHQPPISAVNHHHQDSDQDSSNQISKQPMFEKPLTPSDVGKLNRLVIPKQHAKKHFPLTAGVDHQKGLLLSFEDETGNQWRFRYSYWSSSQSYVLTKGWSRYVKDKGLDAGDVVLFERDRFDGDRMFIGWRRRSVGAQDAQFSYPAHHGHHLPPSLPHPCQHAGGINDNVESGQRYVVASGNPRRVRLFGVNLVSEMLVKSMNERD